SQVGPFSLPEVLQDIRSHLWKLFLQKGTSWIDYPTFCKSARDYFHLNEYLRDPYTPEDREVRFLDMEYDLFKRNLVLFGCIEIEEIQGQHKWDTLISRFRSTLIGLYLFAKATSKQEKD
ncbi:MAG: hypothetical protein Q7K55_02780, partial [Candidatus Levybacteria bacterium]|nr:hypothetical protein [Candidatus Levybacteria bacterium]